MTLKTVLKVLILLALILLALILFTPLNCEAQIYTFKIQPTVVRQTPAHHRNYYHSYQLTYTYRYGPYGGYTYRRAWTNYKVPDTSWGYRLGRPRAKDLGIRGPHKYGNPNPRSLYR